MVIIPLLFLLLHLPQYQLQLQLGLEEKTLKVMIDLMLIILK
jgi:hypothetical protein